MFCRIIIALLVAAVSFSSAARLKYDLSQFLDMASFYNKTDIVVSDDINASNYTFYTNKNDFQISMPILSEMLWQKGLVLRKIHGVYFVDFKEREQDLSALVLSQTKIRQFKFENHVKEDALKVLEMLEINGTYIGANNTLYLTGIKDDKYNELERVFASLDEKPKQMQLKLTIIETDLDKIKNRGASISAYLQSKANDTFYYFVNLITMPFNATSNVVSGSRAGYYSVLNYLDNENISEIKSSPFFTLRSGKEIYFSSVLNIPYLTTNKQFTDNKDSVTNSYEYKDVGLKITIKPVILADGSVDLDLNLVSDELLKSDSEKPTTSKKELRSSYLLKRGEILVLSGINKSTTYNQIYEVPLLSKIWILGELFKYSSKESKNSVLTISMEIL